MDIVFPWGSLLNGLSIVAGGAVGLCFGARMPERMRQLVFQGLGLCVVVLGLQSALTGTRPVLTIGSIVAGCILGELLHIEDGLNSLGNWIKTRVRSSNPRFTEGLVSASVIFCIGAMGIMASLEEGLRGARDIVYAKSIIDAFAAVIMAASYGLGVLFSGISVFVYQGILVFAAGLLTGVLTEPVMAEITATGGIIITGIGLNMLGITQIRLANMIPALVLAPVFASFF